MVLLKPLILFFGNAACKIKVSIAFLKGLSHNIMAVREQLTFDQPRAYFINLVQDGFCHGSGGTFLVETFERHIDNGGIKTRNSVCDSVNFPHPFSIRKLTSCFQPTDFSD